MQDERRQEGARGVGAEGHAEAVERRAGDEVRERAEAREREVVADAAQVEVAAQQIGRADRAVEHAQARRQRAGAERDRSEVERPGVAELRERAGAALRQRRLREVVDLAAQGDRRGAEREVGEIGVVAGERRGRRAGEDAGVRGAQADAQAARIGRSRAQPDQRSVGAESRRRRAERGLQRVVRRRDRRRVGHRHGAVRDRVAAVDDAEVDDRGVRLRRGWRVHAPGEGDGLARQRRGRPRRSCRRRWKRSSRPPCR
jgi:hypothetical protein